MESSSVRSMTDSSREFYRRERKLSRLLGPYEQWIIRVQDCFSWDSPVMTMSALLVIHYICWSIFTYGLRLYFVVPSVALLLVVVDTWRNRIWPEIRLPPPYEEDTEGWTPIDPKALSVPEISWHIAKVWCFVTKKIKQFKKLRLECPLIFALQMSALFTCTGLLGSYISGLLVTYTSLMMLFGWSAVKYFKLNEFVVVKSAEVHLKIMSSLPAFITHFFNKGGSSGEDEFLPENSSAAMSVLSEALQEDERDARVSEERMIPASSLTVEHDLDVEFSHSQISDHSVNDTMRETLFAQGLPSAFPGHEDLTDDELDKVYPDILPDDAAEAQDEEEMQFMPSHFNGMQGADTGYTQSQSDDLNYNIANVLATGLQAIGSTVASAAAAGLEKHYKPQQPPPISQTKTHDDSSDVEPDNEEFVFLESPYDNK